MFKEVYEGEKTNCLVYNLELNTTYEVRICSIFKDIIGDWSEIKEVTTLIDSSILIGSNRCQEFLEKIYEWTGAKKMELLFRSSRDGMSADVFHNRCNNQGPTIVFIQNGKGQMFFKTKQPVTQNNLKNVILKYCNEYIRCPNCKSFKTILRKDQSTRLPQIYCEVCKGEKTIQAIKSRGGAGKRKK